MPMISARWLHGCASTAPKPENELHTCEVPGKTAAYDLFSEKYGFVQITTCASGAFVYNNMVNTEGNFCQLISVRMIKK